MSELNGAKKSRGRPPVQVRLKRSPYANTLQAFSVLLARMEGPERYEASPVDIVAALAAGFGSGKPLPYSDVDAKLRPLVARAQALAPKVALPVSTPTLDDTSEEEESEEEEAAYNLLKRQAAGLD